MSPFWLGVDLGTTFSAAAVHRAGHTEVFELGGHSAAVPSLVFLSGDGTVLIGEAAEWQASTDPSRVAREFKRRIGDPVPVLLGGTPYSADLLTGKLLGWIVEQVTGREGSTPERIVITHPANWGPYKRDQLRQAATFADVADAVLLSEPEAAARFYASQGRLDPGSVVVVYDLGGGTFDVAVLARDEHGGFEIRGEPEGIERLGGIDFDEAVFGHVATALDGAIENLEPDDPMSLQAVARLRAECIRAKEVLSSDTSVAIPVMFPSVQTTVRLTRDEFEAMIRPTLHDTVDALRRTMRNAAVADDDVSAVLLAGGSSRIPLVGELLSAELGRPVAVDAHPKFAVALGAALAAAETDAAVMAAPPPPPAKRSASGGVPSAPAQTSAAVDIGMVTEVVVDRSAEDGRAARGRGGRVHRRAWLWLLVAGLVVVGVTVGVVGWLTLGGDNGIDTDQADVGSAETTGSGGTSTAVPAPGPEDPSVDPDGAAPSPGTVIDESTNTVAGQVIVGGGPAGGVEVYLAIGDLTSPQDRGYTCTSEDGYFWFDDVPVDTDLWLFAGESVELGCDNPRPVSNGAAVENPFSITTDDNFFTIELAEYEWVGSWYFDEGSGDQVVLTAGYVPAFAGYGALLYDGVFDTGPCAGGAGLLGEFIQEEDRGEPGPDADWFEASWGAAWCAPAGSAPSLPLALDSSCDVDELVDRASGDVWEFVGDWYLSDPQTRYVVVDGILQGADGSEWQPGADPGALEVVWAEDCG